MLNLFRRHARKCPYQNKGRDFRKCSCPLSVEGYAGNRYIRESLGLRNWDVAQLRVRDMEADALRPKEETQEADEEDIPVSVAIERFLADATARHLAHTTIAKFRTLTDQVQRFSNDKGFRLVRQWDHPDVISRFRETWQEAPVSALKKFERLRSFFRFCHLRKWTDENPVLALKPPKVTQAPTMPFTPEDMEKIIWACDLFNTNTRYRSQQRTRVKAMVLLMRYSGLRIQDAVTLKRDRIRDGKLFLYTQKTGVPVHLPLPANVVTLLEAIDGYPDRFFWKGQGTRETAVKVWQDTFRRLFQIAGIEGGHSHRFRDTFAVELLLKGAPIEQVSVLLGHSSIKTTEKHYAPWVAARQLQLEETVRASW